MPTARSHMSMYSCTSPIPSVLILPISKEINAPKSITEKKMISE
jgi:hypothetical protein